MRRHGTTGRQSVVRGAIGICALALWILASPPPALADPPSHGRAPALDVSGLNHACGVAAGSKGDLYASSAGEDKIKVLDSSHAELASIANENEPCGLAVDSKGNLLVSERGTGNVVMFVPDAYPLTATPTYSPAVTIDASGEAKGIAVDRTDDRLYVAEGERIDAYRSEVQQLSVASATGGTYKLKFKGQETAAIAFNASAAQVQAALEALSTVGAGNVTVAGSAISFARELAFADVPQLEVSSSLGGNEKQQVKVSATAGTYRLLFAGEQTAAVAFNASAAQLKEALEALAAIAPGDVSVTGGPGDSGGTKPYAVSFEGAYANTDVQPLWSNASALTGSAVVTTTTQGPSASASTSASGGRGIDETQQVGTDAAGGSFKLKFEGEETAAIAFPAPARKSEGAGSVEAALEALAKFAPGDVSVTGLRGGPYAVSFEGAFAATDVPGIEVTSSLSPNEVQKVTLAATAGAFKLKFEGEETAAIAFNASAATVEAALEALVKLEPADVSVTGGPGDAGGTKPYLVAFEGAFAARNVAQVSGAKSGLTGTVTVATAVEGPSASASTTTEGLGAIVEDSLAEYTGVAAYTYIYTGGNPNNLKRHYYLFVADAATDQVKTFAAKEESALKLRRTVSGVDQDENPETADQGFGFGPAGAYLAADPGNESRETRKCAQVKVEGNDQACTQGHFFLYDDASDAVDEFDATGEFVGQVTSGAFEGAEPAALAVERSGTAGDGTLYVSAGASSGAKLLAFRPLGMPGRDPLPELSRVLVKARGVATDCKGYVYVAAEARVRVYDPKGKELTSFEDAEGPVDLAADCAGKVYAVEIPSSEEANLTYYTPAKYPPETGTSYTRHEPLVSGEEGKGMQSVAVNPASEHAFVVGNASFTPVIAEYGPANEGSPFVGECGTGLSLPNARLDIDVYGDTGEVYVTANPQVLTTLRCGAEPELLIPQVKGGGCPSGEFSANPAIALDQSNGHIVEFEPGQPGNSAREYDSSGACVAEFGTFSTTPGTAYRVAVDNSCVLHDPPLTEQTTPKCASLYPSSGNVYVASDGLENGVQPYDVSAFGPLEYTCLGICKGEKPEPITGKADGFGPGKATLNGTVNPKSSPLEECRFEYLTQAKYEENGETFAGAKVVPCAESPEEIGGGGKPVPVHADIEGLEIETPYRFRLSATNKFGTGDGDAEPFTLEPPKIKTKSALPVAYDEATLRGEVDPSGSPSEYHFEYLTQNEYDENGKTFSGAQSTPVDELPAGEGFVAVEAPVTGLEEGTEYRFQLVAENTVGPAAAEGPPFETLRRPPPQECTKNAEYRTGLSAFLPDCRAYELVTPADMLSTSGGVLSLGSFTSTAGHRFFNSWFVAPRGVGAGESVAYKGMVPRVDGHFLRAQRGTGAHPASGWESEPYGFTFAQGAGGDGSQRGVSADQRYFLHDLLAVETPTEEAFPVGNYLRVPSGQASPQCSPDPKAQFALSDPEREFELVGCGDQETDLQADGRFVSAGGTHVIFTSDKTLEEGSPPAGVEAIYDRPAGKAGAEVVSVKPDGSPFGAGEEPRYVATTEEGGAVVFSVDGALYVHREGETTQVAVGPNTYAGISEDGKRVFFMDEIFKPTEVKQMPPPAHLFACDVEGGNCAGPEHQEPIEIASQSTFVNVSADGSNVFFTSEDTEPSEDMELGENENGEEAEAGEPNLYAWDGATTRFVAVLHPQDLDSFRKGAGDSNVENQEDLLQWTNVIPGQFSSSGSLYEAGRAYSPTRSTPDGEVFVFQSHARLTPYDNEGKGEIYRYAPAAALGSQLTCVSCDPSGAPHDSPADALFDTVVLGAINSSTMIPNVTDDGRRVFFESREPLLPEDANEANDVYEWKALGTTGPGGDECERPGGCLALISSGQGEEQSYFYGMSADGEDAFFVTQEKLVGADALGSSSIYDARVLGGIPDPPVPAPCQGDACQGQGSTPPVLPAPASTGPGTDSPQGHPGCAKGKHRVKGRCVKKQSNKRKRHRKHSKKHRASHNRGARR